MIALSAWRENPIVEVENDACVIAFALAQREIGAGAVLGRHRAQAQRADILARRAGAISICTISAFCLCS